MNTEAHNNEPILTTLTLKSPAGNRSEGDNVECLCCIRKFEFPDKQDDYLGHLFLEHRLVIADVNEIAKLKEYLWHWKKEFIGHPIEFYCTTMLLDQLPDGTASKNEKYYLLSDVVPSDAALRHRLHNERLEEVLARHQFERTDRNFTRGCLHCRIPIEPTRGDFVRHLFDKHFLQIGKPENLVYVDELIDVLQKKLESFECLFCEGVFKDRSTLKEHMRKKGHKRINPDNKSYDKYFLSTYQNGNADEWRRKVHSKPSSKSPHVARKSEAKRTATGLSTCSSSTLTSSSVFQTDDSDSDWSGWEEDRQTFTCLFCTAAQSDYSSAIAHMKAEHSFDFEREIIDLNFYEKVKCINYVRRQVYLNRCPVCTSKYESVDLLKQHMSEQQHFGFNEKRCWDQPEYFFSTFEDDAFLCHLDDDFPSSKVCTDAVVISEDCQLFVNPVAESLSLEELKL